MAGYLYRILIGDALRQRTATARQLHQFILRLLRRSFASPIEVELAERAFYIQSLRQGLIVVDVGANIGELTLLFSRLVSPEGVVHAFEPSGTNYERLATMVDIENLSNVVLNNIALAEVARKAKLYIYDDEHSGWNSFAERPLQQHGVNVSPIGVEEVKTTTIDLYCLENRIDYIDLLKIDVEGAEFQVLLGAHDMLQGRQVHCCVFEFGATTFDMGNTADEIESYLNQFGYTVQNIVSGNLPFPGKQSARSARFSMHVARP